jgi:uncharacterized lipoprotein NlpE involved in copper resistance
MRKSISVVTIGLSMLLLGCKQASKTIVVASKPETAIDSDITDGHNSSNSLDVDGVYKGTLPCADCGGIETEIVLGKDNSFVKRTIYQGKDGKVFEEKGSYAWNSEGNTITLSGIKSGPHQYFVGENTLIQLNMDGKRITGNLADKYVLRK